MRNVRMGLAAAGLLVGLAAAPAAQGATSPPPPVVASTSCSADALLPAIQRPTCTTRAITCPESTSCREPAGRVAAFAGVGSAGATGRTYIVGSPGSATTARCGPSAGQCSATMVRTRPRPREQAARFQSSCAWNSAAAGLFGTLTCNVSLRGERDDGQVPER